MKPINTDTVSAFLYTDREVPEDHVVEPIEELLRLVMNDGNLFVVLNATTAEGTRIFKLESWALRKLIKTGWPRESLDETDQRKGS